MGSEIANLSIVQKVIGQAATDNIGLIESTLKWQGNSFIIIDQTVILKGNFINQSNRSKEISNKKDFLIGTRNLYENNWKSLDEYIDDNVNFDSSSIYWYYLAVLQLFAKDLIEALKSINMNLSFQYPYPSKEKALILKENIEYSIRLNK